MCKVGWDKKNETIIINKGEERDERILGEKIDQEFCFNIIYRLYNDNFMTKFCITRHSPNLF